MVATRTSTSRTAIGRKAMSRAPRRLRGPSRAVRFFAIFAMTLLSMSSARARAQQPPATAPSAATQPATAATLSPAGKQNLLAHGTNEYLWLAHVTPGLDHPGPAMQTRIDMRTGGVEAWQHITILPTRVTCLANLSGQLAVLQESGDWVLVGEEGGSTGQPLPNGAKMLSIAADGDTLWALGAPASAPASQPAATQPAATQASAGGAIQLYSRSQGAWHLAPNPVPDEVEANAPACLAMIEHAATVAFEHPDGSIGVVRLTSEGWQTLGPVHAPAQRGAFKIVSSMTPLTLWLAGNDADELVMFPAGGPPKSTLLKPVKSPIAERTAAYAVNAIRELAMVDGKLTQQDYNAQTLAPEQGGGGPVALPAPATPEYRTLLFRWGLVAAVSLAIFMSARRRGDLNAVQVDLQNVVLADMLRRLGAGLIDAVPFVLPALVLLGLQRVGNPDLGPETTWAFIGALFIYLVHTAASETLTGRTLGKYLLGLRVVRLDGGTPEPSSLLIRNFLRVVDVGLAGIPLVFILYSPLRQRIGDVAGGTIVIRDRVKPEGSLIEPPTIEPEPVPPVPSDVEPPAATG